jgi:hypothetical protein
VFLRGTLFAKPRIRVSSPGRSPEKCSAAEHFRSPCGQEFVAKESRVPNRNLFRTAPHQGSLSDIDQHRLVGDDQSAVAVPPPLMATGRGRAGWIAARFATTSAATVAFDDSISDKA